MAWIINKCIRRGSIISVFDNNKKIQYIRKRTLPVGVFRYRIRYLGRRLQGTLTTSCKHRGESVAGHVGIKPEIQYIKMV